jgi:hypothetical protein
MAYATGVSTTITDLVNAMFAFAKANGFTAGPTWTKVRTNGQTQSSSPTADESNRTYQCAALVKGGQYFTFSWADDADMICGNLATAIDTGVQIQYQVGACPGGGYISHTSNCFLNPAHGPHVSYHLFGDGKMVHLALEIVAGVFIHFSFGMATGVAGVADFPCMSGQYAAPQYLTDSTNTYHRLPWWNQGGYGFSPYGLGSHMARSPLTGRATNVGYNTNETDRRYMFIPVCTDNHGLKAPIYSGPNQFNSRAPIFPVQLVESTVAEQSPFYQLGEVSGVGHMNIRNIAPKEIVNTDWMCFPLSQKNGPGTSFLNTGNRGIAYKK